jgi:hypothetical protein
MAALALPVLALTAVVALGVGAVAACRRRHAL